MSALEVPMLVAARHPSQHVLAIDQPRTVVSRQRVELRVFERIARHQGISGTGLHTQVTVDASAIVNKELVELALLAVSDMVEQLDGPLRPAPRDRTRFL